MKKILIIAFFYPPSQSIGGQRTLKLSEYLPDFGWQPIVLTAEEQAYDRVEHSQIIPKHLDKLVYRTTAWDIQNHLSYKGKHFSWSKIPDRWGSWIPGAISQGKKIIKEHQPDVIFSSAPTSSAHYIAYRLAKKSGIPWVAEYRDPMQYHYCPEHWLIDWVNKIIDQKTMEHCQLAIFASEEASELYQNKFPSKASERFTCIENGFDEQNFKKLKELSIDLKELFSKNKFSLLYSGAIYDGERDPGPIFQALSQLQNQQQISADNFELVFQGSGKGSAFKELLAKLNISDLVKFTPSVSYMASLESMMQSSALLLIQGPMFHLQIPAKFYEYIRSQKPIIALSPHNSATIKLAQKVDGCFPANSIDEIKNAIGKVLENQTYNRKYSSYSRYQRAKTFAKKLEMHL